MACAALVLSAPAALAARREVVRLFPEANAIFAAAGLPVNLIGLEFADVAGEVGQEGGRSVLTVSGRLRNPTKAEVSTPPLALTIRGGDGAVLYDWTARLEAAAVPAGATVPFAIRLAAPPPAGRTVAVTFGARDQQAAVALR